MPNDVNIKTVLSDTTHGVVRIGVLHMYSDTIRTVHHSNLA